MSILGGPQADPFEVTGERSGQGPGTAPVALAGTPDLTDPATPWTPATVHGRTRSLLVVAFAPAQHPRRSPRPRRNR